MKTLVYVTCLFAVATYVRGYEEYEMRVATGLSLPVEDVHACFVTSTLQPDEIRRVDNLRRSDLDDPENKPLIHKLGCLAWCLLEKNGATVGSQIYMDKIHQMADEKIPMSGTKEGEMLHRVLDMCASRVKGNTDTCSKAFDFVNCFFTSRMAF